MSLQVWLPLNGNLNNQGIANITATNNGATTDSSGKMGGCYSFGSNKYIQVPITNIDLNSTQISFACWINISSWNSSYDAIMSIANGTGWNTSRATLSRNNTASTLTWNIADGSTSLRVSSTTSLSLNTWYHVATTYNGSQLKIYINGILDSSANATLSIVYAGNFNIGGWSGNNYPINAKINDVRLYNHCLSSKEVAELAKGLVLHYPLNRDGFGQNNLALNTHDLNVASSKNNLNMYIRSGTRQLRQDGFYESKCTGNWNGLSFWANQLNLTLGAKITYSFYIYGNGSSRAFSFYPMMYNLSGTRDTTSKLPISIDGGSYTSANSKTFGNTTATTPEYHYVTFEWSQDMVNIISNGGSIELSIQVHGTWNTDDWACLFAPKVELGEKPTPWTPALTDTLYSALGLSNNIIYDTSGYGYDGEIINNISYQSDSPRYSVSIHMSATNQKIKISNFLTAGFGNSYTFAWWEKISSVNPMHWGFADGIRLNGMYTGRLWNTGDSSSNPLYTPGTTTQVTAPSTDVWHHWVMTGDGTTCKVYQDGVLWGQAKTYKAISGSTIYINGWNSGTDYCSDNASMSDFRIYCTALTAEQVKELYNTSATIDKNGNVYAREVVE